MCVKDKSKLRVKGTLYGANMNMIEVRLQPCIDNSVINNINSTICATYDDQAIWYNGKNLVIYLVNTYFDFTDFVSPVKRFIDDTFFWPI